MSAQHTPGPWTFSRWNEFGDMRFYIAQADGAPHTPQYSDVATLIAETTSNEWQSIQEANARLIAAAPELLEALKGLLPLATEGCIGGPDAVALINAATAAIAKAQSPASGGTTA